MVVLILTGNVTMANALERIIYVTAQKNLEMLIMDLIAQINQMKHYKDVALLGNTLHILQKFASVNLMNLHAKTHHIINVSM